MQEYLTRIHTVRQKIDELAKKIDIPALRQERERLGKEAEAPNLWDDREKAQAILKRLNDVQDEINEWENLIKRSRDTQELIELNDESLLAEVGSLVTCFVCRRVFVFPASSSSEPFLERVVIKGIGNTRACRPQSRKAFSRLPARFVDGISPLVFRVVTIRIDVENTT